jgi:hypothetical protein
MPCDIGYKSYAKVAIPVPQPQEFAERSEAPDIDAELFEKLGIEDPEFLEWASELNARPLLEEALKRALAKVNAGGVDFTVDAKGMLQAKGRFTSAREKQRLSEIASAVSNLWQFEILGIVVELLDYEVTITTKGEVMTLEAEEAGKSHPCDYIKITRARGVSEITFEHFKSRKALDIATAKLLVLAQKLGVKLMLGEREVSLGDPFPEDVRHRDYHRHGHTH